MTATITLVPKVYVLRSLNLDSHQYTVLNKYRLNILERVLVENIIPRNVTINRGAAEVDNHISRDEFSTSTLSRMLYLFYYTEHLLTMVREVPKTTQCILATNGWTNIFLKRVVFVNSSSSQTVRDRRLNKPYHYHWWGQTFQAT